MDHPIVKKETIKAEPGSREEDGINTSYTEIDIHLQDVKEECLEHFKSVYITTGKIDVYFIKLCFAFLLTSL